MMTMMCLLWDGLFAVPVVFVATPVTAALMRYQEMWTLVYLYSKTNTPGRTVDVNSDVLLVNFLTQSSYNMH